VTAEFNLALKLARFNHGLVARLAQKASELSIRNTLYSGGFHKVMEEIREELRLCLAGSRSIEDFEDWFLPATWDTDDVLASQIRLRLAEHDRGDLDEDELRNMLFAALGEDSFEIVVADTADEAITLPERDLAAVA
jgi:hypothetical protein